MNFNWLLDGSIVGLYLLATMVAGLMVRKYVVRVDHFLVAGREMNIYLGIASLAATEFGIVTCMYTAQAGYTRGFAGAVPGLCNAIAMFVVGWTGFCVKPLRGKPPQSYILDGWSQVGFQRDGSSVVISDCFIAGRRCSTSRK